MLRSCCRCHVHLPRRAAAILKRCDTSCYRVKRRPPFYAHAFLPLINRPTRITQNSATITDNILRITLGSWNVVRMTYLWLTQVIMFQYSILENTRKVKTCETNISTRNYSYANKLSFQQASDEIDWSEKYVISDTQTALSLFYSRFTKLLDKNFPREKTKLQYNTRKPWLTQV